MIKYRVRYTKGEESICTAVDFSTYKAAREFVDYNDMFGRFSWYEILEVADNGESRVLN